MDDGGGSKLSGIRQIVRLKEMFQKWQTVTLGSKESNHDSDVARPGGIPPMINKRLTNVLWKHRNCGRINDCSDLCRRSVMVLVASFFHLRDAPRFKVSMREIREKDAIGRFQFMEIVGTEEIVTPNSQTSRQFYPLAATLRPRSTSPTTSNFGVPLVECLSRPCLRRSHLPLRQPPERPGLASHKEVGDNLQPCGIDL
ncbi:hypothetical protein ACSQ67_006438 [Phaseolus vulgaris]